MKSQLIHNFQRHNITCSTRVQHAIMKQLIINQQGNIEWRMNIIPSSLIHTLTYNRLIFNFIKPWQLLHFLLISWNFKEFMRGIWIFIFVNLLVIPTLRNESMCAPTTGCSGCCICLCMTIFVPKRKCSSDQLCTIIPFCDWLSIITLRLHD